MDLPQIRTHDFRHTFATLLIEAGVPIKVVSELLGQSSVGITLEVYGHVTSKMRDQGASPSGNYLNLLKSDQTRDGADE